MNRYFLYYAEMSDRNVNPQPKLYIIYAFFIFDESSQCFKLQQAFLKKLV